MEFRKDINGLRALAVAAVVAFHFKSSWVPGGFAGVDIFFVISGYLMTRVICGGIEKEKFGVFKFYIARGVRIIPAMLLMIASALLVCFFLYPPIEYRELSIYSISALVFLSNVYFWKNTSYFNPDIDSNILVHTWSLSAEWQFYLIYPILLLLAYKFLTKKQIILSLYSLCFLSFLFSVWFSIYHPDGSYYLLPSRIWEMLVGGAAFFFSDKRLQKSAVKVASFVVMVASFFVISKEDYWPGYMALMPVAATFLFIASGDISSVFKNKYSEYIGLRSYSIYLWHWPIYVLLNKNFVMTLPMLMLGGVLTLAVSEFSYRNVEVKIAPIKIAIFMFLLALFSVLVYKTNGYNYQSYSNQEAVMYMEKYNGYEDVEKDRYGLVDGLEAQADYDSVFLWGDSHAESLAYGLNSFFKTENIPFAYTSSGNCMAAIGIGMNEKKEGSKDYQDCVDSNDYAFDFIATKKPRLVIFVQRDQHDENDFAEMIEKINDPKIRYLLLGPVPQWKGGAPLKIAYEKLTGDDPYADKVVSHLFAVDSRAKEIYAGGEVLEYVSVLDKICLDDYRCIIYIDENKSSLHWDNSHLSLEGSEYLVKEHLAKELLSGVQSSAE